MHFGGLQRTPATLVYSFFRNTMWSKVADENWWIGRCPADSSVGVLWKTKSRIDLPMTFAFMKASAGMKGHIPNRPLERVGWQIAEGVGDSNPKLLLPMGR